MTTGGKNIVLCSDGTGNTVIKGRGTNVWKTYETLNLTGHRYEGIREQIAFYDDGVGTDENKFLKVTLEAGQSYREGGIGQVLESGDKVWLDADDVDVSYHLSGALLTDV